MKFVLAVPAGVLLMAGTAAAQDPVPASTAAVTTPDAAAASGQGAASVSNDEVERFALAALLVQQIADDQSVEPEQKQPAMAAAVQQVGIEPQRFNEIAVATQTDEELNERVQLAAARHIEAAQQSQ